MRWNPFYWFKKINNDDKSKTYRLTEDGHYQLLSNNTRSSIKSTASIAPNNSRASNKSTPTRTQTSLVNSDINIGIKPGKLGGRRKSNKTMKKKK